MKTKTFVIGTFFNGNNCMHTVSVPVMTAGGNKNVLQAMKVAVMMNEQAENVNDSERGRKQFMQ